MHLRARKARLSVRWSAAQLTNELVRAMTYRMYGAFIASLSAVALMLAANETVARSGGAPRGGFTSSRSISHPSVAQSLRHHRRNTVGAFWPGDFFYGPSNGEPIGDVTPPASGDVHYTYTYDVPWDWAHRYPPNVTPSDRPYVPSCPAETVTVAGRDGREQTVNVMRCY
jgi:hypothetical protein